MNKLVCAYFLCFSNVSSGWKRGRLNKITWFYPRKIHSRWNSNQFWSKVIQLQLQKMFDVLAPEVDRLFQHGKKQNYWHKQNVIHDICHFFSMDDIFGSICLHIESAKNATKQRKLQQLFFNKTANIA